MLRDGLQFSDCLVESPEPTGSAPPSAFLVDVRVRTIVTLELARARTLASRSPRLESSMICVYLVLVEPPHHRRDPRTNASRPGPRAPTYSGNDPRPVVPQPGL